MMPAFGCSCLMTRDYCLYFDAAAVKTPLPGCCCHAFCRMPLFDFSHAA